MLKPINAMDIACIRQRNDFEPELRCLEELLVLREAVIALTNPSIVNNQQREIAYRLSIQGIEVHPRYDRRSSHGWPTSDCGLPRSEVAAYQRRVYGENFDGDKRGGPGWSEYYNDYYGNRYKRIK